MKLSLFSDYSLRVLMYAALQNGAFRLDEVTEAYGISRHHLAQVVHSLGKLGYLRTQRGRGGGIRLAMAPAEIRLGQIVRQTEDQPALVECFDPVRNTCRIHGSCRLKGILGEAVAAFYGTLDRYTLHDLVSGPHQHSLRKALVPPER